MSPSVVHLRLLLAASALCLASASNAAEFLGPEGCRGCHSEAYEAWSKSPHARSLDTLDERQKADLRCVSCHAPAERKQKVTQVTCETCHGGGEHYASDYVMRDAELARLVGLKDPTEQLCRSCHDDTSPALRPFDFTHALQKIDHWSEERRRRSGETSGDETASKDEPARAGPTTAARPRGR